MCNIHNLIADYSEIIDPTEITEKLNKYFSTVGSKLSKKMPSTEMLPTQSIVKPIAKCKFGNIPAKQVCDLLELKMEKPVV